MLSVSISLFILCGFGLVLFGFSSVFFHGFSLSGELWFGFREFVAVRGVSRVCVSVRGLFGVLLWFRTMRPSRRSEATEAFFCL